MGPRPAASSRDLPDAGGIWGPPWTGPGTRDVKRPRPHARLGLAAVGLCVLMMVAIPLARPYLPRTTVGFVSRSLTELRSDGRGFRFDGLNIPDATGAPCWHPSDLSKSLDAIGPGQEVARVFSFQRTATTNGARDWTYVDRMLSIFRAHGERVIMVLTDQWKGQPCTDSATDRTLAWYQTGYRTTIEGATTYRDWVSQVVGRYRDDPTIAFWQLVNEGEARNPGGTCSESIAREALRAFADDIGGLVKSLDANHLVSLGTTPGECGSNDADYGYIHASAPIDLCDYHDYGFNTSPMGNTDPYNGLQVSLDRCHAAGKAFFVGEVGLGVGSLNPPTTARRATLFTSKLWAQFTAGSVGELIWRWSPVYHPEQGQEVPPDDPALGLLTEY
jgi:mannan endo-1,4-beta-mannosidase